MEQSRLATAGSRSSGTRLVVGSRRLVLDTQRIGLRACGCRRHAGTGRSWRSGIAMEGRHLW